MHMQNHSEKKAKQMKNNKTIKVNYLARVEGEGSINIKIKDGKVSDVKFGIFEPPRFFEAFLRGRLYSEAPDITARICGICPIAYMMSSCQAMETAFGVKVDGQLRELRKLIYCGEWIESQRLPAGCRKSVKAKENRQ
jgi:sulfhydrogenase subunit alpha